MKGKFEYRGKDNEALNALKKVIEEVAAVFIGALPGTQERMSYKAMEFKGVESEKEQDMMLDVIMTALAMEIGEKAPKEGFVYSTSYEKKDESIIVWIHARRKLDGVKEDEEEAPAEAPAPIAAQKHSLEEVGASDVNYVI